LRVEKAGAGIGAEGGLTAPMPGRIIALIAKPGDKVEKGVSLLILEAMKMEHTITTPIAGIVKDFFSGLATRLVVGLK
jgi:3-methylcrotonyl-CoA carboxylase alpha subunit